MLIANGPDGAERQERVTLSGNATRTLSEHSPTSLTAAELENCALYFEYCPFMLDDARKAIKYARRLFNRSIPPGSSGVGDVNDNTRANSFKHSYWVSLMVNSIAQNSLLRDEFYVALSFAEAHERDQPNTIDSRRSSAIDDHNNRVGFRLGVANSPDKHGNKHNDVFYCNVLRNRIKRAKQVGFKKGRDVFIPSAATDRLVFRYKYPNGNMNDPPTIRLRPIGDFASNDPCK